MGDNHYQQDKGAVAIGSGGQSVFIDNCVTHVYGIHPPPQNHLYQRQVVAPSFFKIGF